ncbi:MAG: outer membrane protein transport protein [Verrucomicrobiota bacterium]
MIKITQLINYFFYLIVAATMSEGAATRLAFIDSFATARGNAFTATASNPSAVFYNAAALTQLDGTEIQANMFAISLGYEFESSMGLGSQDMDDEFQAVPSFFFSHRFEDAPIAAGFGVYAPFALKSDWGINAPFSQLDPRVPFYADLQYVKYHGVVAWQITENISIAAGISFDDTDVDIRAPALRLEGDDQLIGYSISLLWKPHQEHSFGLNYQGATEASYNGKTSITGVGDFDSAADLVLPESIVFGYAFTPNENWSFEFNLDWTNWDKVNDLTIEGLPDFLGPAPSYILNWKSAYIWEFGVSRFFENGWYLSGGYTHVENAIPEETLLPIVPDSNRDFFAVGVGREHRNVSWQLTYQYAHADDRSIVDNVFPTVNGDYDLDSQAVSFSIAYKF